MNITLPYGSSEIVLDLPDNLSLTVLHPNRSLHTDHVSPLKRVNDAINHPLGGLSPFEKITRNSRIAITINDKTRPVPNNTLLNPLLEKLRVHGVKQENVTLFIASGTHQPMQPHEYKLILGEEIINKYRIIPHNCDDNDKLYEIGITSRGTPVSVNKEFFDSDLKIVVGDIELHHFAGYSGGVKSAAIGLCGRSTINANHRFLLDERSNIGNYQDNPLRQDIEEIGKMIGVDCALNAVLDENKRILDVFFGEALSVMRSGIRLVNQLCVVPVEGLFDVVIASAGGYPKDINLYQSQKAMTHASQFCQPGGTILLFAECREGIGSQGYIDYMEDLITPGQVIEKFTRDGFQVGPHKAYQVARILEKYRVYMHSSINDEIVNGLLIKPFPRLTDLLEFISSTASPARKIAVLPYATACMPGFNGGDNG